MVDVDFSGIRDRAASAESVESRITADSSSPRSAPVGPSTCPALGSRNGIMYIRVLGVTAKHVRPDYSPQFPWMSDGYSLRVSCPQFDVPLTSEKVADVESLVGTELAGRTLEYVGSGSLTFEVMKGDHLDSVGTLAMRNAAASLPGEDDTAPWPRATIVLRDAGGAAACALDVEFLRADANNRQGTVSVLRRAVRRGARELVRVTLLLASPGAPDEKDACLMAALPNLGLLRMLLDKQFAPKIAHVEAAIRLGNGSAEMVLPKVVLHAGKATQPSGQVLDEQKEHLVYLACSLGQDKLVTSLLNWAKLGVAQIERLDSGRSSYVRYPDVQQDPFMLAAIRSPGTDASVFNIVNELLRRGFSPNVRSPVDSWTPLHAGVERGNEALVQLLVQHADAKLLRCRKLHFTPIHLACQMGEFSILPHLLKLLPPTDGFVRHTSDASATSKDVYGRTSLDILNLTEGTDPDCRPGLLEAVELLQGLEGRKGGVEVKVIEDHRDSRDFIIYEL